MDDPLTLPPPSNFGQGVAVPSIADTYNNQNWTSTNIAATVTGGDVEYQSFFSPSDFGDITADFNSSDRTFDDSFSTSALDATGVEIANDAQPQVTGGNVAPVTSSKVTGNALQELVNGQKENPNQSKVGQKNIPSSQDKTLTGYNQLDRFLANAGVALVGGYLQGERAEKQLKMQQDYAKEQTADNRVYQKGVLDDQRAYDEKMLATLTAKKDADAADARRRRAYAMPTGLLASVQAQQTGA